MGSVEHRGRRPIPIEEAFADPPWPRALARSLGPYRPVQRYFASDAEMKSVELDSRSARVQPWLRQEWARGVPLVDGVEPLLDHPPFVAAARALLGADEVVFHSMYANLIAPSRGVDAGHFDIPTFRGMHRDTHPPWLLSLMLRSGHFDAWHVPMATCVSWLYEGEGGGFSYWPDGRDGPRVDLPCRTNTGLASDGDRVFHRVRSVAPSRAIPIELDLDSTLRWSDGRWRVVTAGREVAALLDAQLRFSVTWRAIAAGADEGEPLTLARALETFADALDWPELLLRDPGAVVRDPEVVARLSLAYPAEVTRNRR